MAKRVYRPKAAPRRSALRRMMRSGVPASTRVKFKGKAIRSSQALAVLEATSLTELERDCRLEVPLGELCKGIAPTLLILGPGKARPDAIESLTGGERFNAQGLEGKAVVIRPLKEALAALSFLPEYRARVVMQSGRSR